METRGTMPARNPEMMYKQLGTEVVVLNRKTKQYHVLNSSAAMIFELATGERSGDSIAAMVADRFGVSHEQAEADVKETIAGMEKLGLLVPSAGAKVHYEKPAIKEVTEKDFNEAVAGGAALACRSLLGP